MKTCKRRAFLKSTMAAGTAVSMVPGLVLPAELNRSLNDSRKVTKMRFAVELGTIGDRSFEDAIKHCQDLGINAISVQWGRVPGFSDKGYIETASLKTMSKQLEDAGLAFSAMAGAMPLAITEDSAEGKTLLDNVRRSMESMAAVNAKIITFPPLSGNTPWTQIVAFYGKLTEQAEQYGIRLATQTHGFFRNYDVISRLLKDVPSASNGFTFCTGNMWHGEGEKIYDLTRQLKDRIFFMHIRNVKTGLGEKEFWLDEGNIDYPKFVKVLKEIDYRYDLRSEHLPTDHYGQPMASDLSSAWALGYFKALIQTV